MKEGDMLLSTKPVIESIDLIVNKRVHWVEDDTFNTCLFTFPVSIEVVENRKEEAFCFSCTCLSSNNKSRFSVMRISSLRLSNSRSEEHTSELQSRVDLVC